jgi:hypothetical protein
MRLTMLTLLVLMEPCFTGSRIAEKQQNLFAALEYGLLVYKNLLECRWDHFEIVLESVKLRFGTISNNCCSPIWFHFNHVKNFNKDIKIETHFKISKKIWGSYVDLDIHFCQNSWILLYLVTQSL